MNPFGEDPFGNVPDDSKMVDKLYLYSISKVLTDVAYRLGAVQQILKQRPDIMPVETTFEMNAVIAEYQEKMDALLKRETVRLLEEQPELKTYLRSMGVEPDDLV